MGTLRTLTIGTLSYILVIVLMLQPNMQRALLDVVGHLMSNPRRQRALNDSVLVNENVPSAPNCGGLLAGTGLDEFMAVTTDS